MAMSRNFLLNFVVLTSIVLTLLNGAILLKSRRVNTQNGGFPWRSDSSSTISTRRRLQEENEDERTTTTTTTSAETTPTKLIRSKTLVGIFVDDSFNGCSYRKRHRSLFKIWNDSRVCTLADFQTYFNANDEVNKERCELIYTFVAGVNKDKDGPTEIVNNATHKLLVDRPVVAYKQDLNDPDVTLLNIRENMNDGKSQTFFYFASVMSQTYGFEYAMKLDADAMLHLHDFFLFADKNLPPAPWNTNIFVGALRDKYYWPPKANPADMSRLESFWGNEYDGVHVYTGQMYLMSTDLAAFVATEAPMSRTRIGPGGYLEGHEDHDLSAMVFHSPTPIHMVTIGKTQRFWEHPVKGQPRYERILRRENARMAEERFEGRILRRYTSEEARQAALLGVVS
eukprot:CAMPEP_0117019286 /NCGR_PEP_ID=MMETSP0472-20121206/14825_1 /TAXON_ID=693140 ORGANISM="Tiarina fusus, Strain LIS" /NCGR_SAMPLE_ID=MMETSP0472 /ASSEMBLY_ACC=CAM_ASM_000603 /LENGTH=396 /DNA_ID=CAMNT_0004724221 /DNA_START=171 /DNA_END=1361 /DNA_ORIENTATION=+